MGQFISVEIEADAVLDAMANDSTFAFDMWAGIAERLHMGGLLDDCMDLVQGSFDERQRRIFLDALRLMVTSIEQRSDLA